MMNGTNPSIGKSSIRQGLEDGLYAGSLAIVGALIAAGTSNIPAIPVLYGAGLAGLMAGLISYGRARQLQGG